MTCKIAQNFASLRGDNEMAVVHENGERVLPDGQAERRHGPRRIAHGRRGEDDDAVSTDDLRALIAQQERARAREDALRDKLDAERDARLTKLERFRDRVLPLIGVVGVIATVIGVVVGRLADGLFP